jgi:hypothetical protein
MSKQVTLRSQDKHKPSQQAVARDAGSDPVETSTYHRSNLLESIKLLTKLPQAFSGVDFSVASHFPSLYRDSKHEQPSSPGKSACMARQYYIFGSFRLCRRVVKQVFNACFTWAASMENVLCPEAQTPSRPYCFTPKKNDK